MKSSQSRVRRLLVVPALVFFTMIIACGCSTSRAQSEPQQTAEAAKAKQPAKMQAGAKYVVNIDRAPLTNHRSEIERIHKARVFNDTGKMMELEKDYMQVLHKGDIVVMLKTGALYCNVRTSQGGSGWIETENLTYFSEP